MSAKKFPLKGSVLVVTLIVTNWWNKAKLNFHEWQLVYYFKRYMNSLPNQVCTLQVAHNQFVKTKNLMFQRIYKWIFNNLRQKLIFIIWILPFVGSFVGYNYLLNIIKVLKIYQTRKIIKNLLLCKLHMFYK